VAQTKEQLEARIAALEGAGLEHEAEDKALAALSAKAPAAKAAPGKPVAKKAAPATAPEEESEELMLNVSHKAFVSGGGNWVAPETEGVKPGMLVDIVQNEERDTIMFIFQSEGFPDDEEPWRGSVLCTKVSADDGVAWKVRQTLDNLTIPYEEDEGSVKVTGKWKGTEVDVLYSDIVSKGVTQRRIQAVGLRGTLEEAV